MDDYTRLLTKKLLFEFSLSHDVFGPEILGAGEIGTTLKFAAAVTFVGRTYKWVMVDLLLLLNVICAFIFLRIAKNFNEVLLSSTDTDDDNHRVRHF